jgi:tripartite-type tricarboxylate transporter receptor subunit TctC
MSTLLKWIDATRLTLAVFAAFAGAAAASDDYPNRPIRIIVPAAPGVGLDLDARPIAQKIGEILQQSIVIENRPAAGGIVALESAAKAAPDGYTLVIGGVGNFVAVPLLHRKLAFDLDRDFVLISVLQTLPVVLTVHPSLGAGSVQEFLALARARPASITYGSQGNGTFIHLAGELFESVTATDLKHVPYGAQSPFTDLAGGHLVAMFSGIAPVIGNVKAGKLKVLAVSSRERVEIIGDVPTFIEAGVPAYDAAAWNGLIAPHGTPAAIVVRLNDAAVKAVHSPEVKERMLRFGGAPVGSSPEAFAALVRTERVKWGKVIQDAKLQAD